MRENDPSTLNALGVFHDRWKILLPDMLTSALEFYDANPVLTRSVEGTEYFFSCRREEVRFDLGIRLHEGTYHIQTQAPNQDAIWETWNVLLPVTNLLASLDTYLEKTQGGGRGR